MDKFEQKRQDYTHHIAKATLASSIKEMSLKKMATAAGTSDRMLMHYFKDKQDIETAVLTAISQELIDLLQQPDLKLEFTAFVRFLRQAIDEPRIKPYLNLWFEITHLATSQGSRIRRSRGRSGNRSTIGLNRSMYQQRGKMSISKLRLLFVFTEGLVVLNKIGLEERMDAAVEAMIALTKDNRPRN